MADFSSMGDVGGKKLDISNNNNQTSPHPQTDAASSDDRNCLDGGPMSNALVLFLGFTRNTNIRSI